MEIGGEHMNNMNPFPFKNAPSIQEMNDMIEKSMGSNRNASYVSGADGPTKREGYRWG